MATKTQVTTCQLGEHFLIVLSLGRVAQEEKHSTQCTVVENYSDCENHWGNFFPCLLLTGNSGRECHFFPLTKEIIHVERCPMIAAIRFLETSPETKFCLLWIHNIVCAYFLSLLSFLAISLSSHASSWQLRTKRMQRSFSANFQISSSTQPGNGSQERGNQVERQSKSKGRYSLDKITFDGPFTVCPSFSVSSPVSSSEIIS